MKTLNPIGADETVIAQGLYEHRMGADVTTTRERWQWHRLATPDTTRLRVEFTTDAYTLLAELDYLKNRITRMQYTSDPTDDNGRPVRGTYTVQADTLHVERHIGDDTHLEETIPWSQSVVFDAPFLASKGIAIVRLAGGNSKSTFAPHLQLAERAGDLAKKQAEFAGETPQGRQYRYGRDFWLDEYDMVTRAVDDTMVVDYVMELTEYDRS